MKKDMDKIILAIDSFKGCLSSQEVEKIAADSLHEMFPSCRIVSIPVADGGEGMLDCFTRHIGGKMLRVRVHDPLMRPVTARYNLTDDGKTAVIEMAEACGLLLLSPEERNPETATSFGLGELIGDALDRGCRDFLIGIGGSATNDAGMGMMQALGAVLYDGKGNALGHGGKILGDIARIDVSRLHPALRQAGFTVACDVRNPFCGPQGATFVFGLQKGGSREQLVRLEKGMEHAAKIIGQTTGCPVSGLPGAGAAGGTGGTLRAFFDAALKPGIELLLDKAGFDAHLHDAALVLTGEGRADSQTLQGKVPAGVLRRAQKAGVPVWLMAGKAEEKHLLEEAGFARVIEVSPPYLPVAEAIKPSVARQYIRKAIAESFKDAGLTQ